MSSDNSAMVRISADTADIKEGLRQVQDNLVTFAVDSQKRGQEIEKSFEKVSVKLREFGEASKRVLSPVDSLGSKLRDLSVIGMGAEKAFSWIKSAISQFSAFGDQLDKFSIRSGIVANDLSKLKFAAEQCGGNFEVLSNGLRDLNKNLELAGQGDKGNLDRLAQLDLSPAILSGLTMKEKFLEVADALSKLNSDAKKGKLAMELFGEAGYKLLPMLKEGKEGIKDLMDEAENTDIGMSDEDVKLAAQLTDEINRLNSSISDLTRSAVAGIAGPMIKAMESARGWIGILKSCVPALSTITPFLFRMGVALVALRVGQMACTRVQNVYFATLQYGKGILQTYRASLIAQRYEAAASATSYNVMVASLRAAQVGTTSLSMSFRALGVSIKSVLMSNPLGWCLLLVGGLVELCMYFSNSEKSIRSFAESMEDARKQISETQEEIANYQSKMDRLKELSKQEHLSNREKAESARLVAQLNNQYPTLNLEIDKMTGKLKEAAKKQKILNDLMRDELIAKKEVELEKAKEIKKESEETLKPVEEDVAFRWKYTYERVLKETGDEDLAKQRADEHAEVRKKFMVENGDGWFAKTDTYKKAEQNLKAANPEIARLEEQIKQLKEGAPLTEQSGSSESEEVSGSQLSEDKKSVEEGMKSVYRDTLQDEERELADSKDKFDRIFKSIDDAMENLDKQRNAKGKLSKDLQEKYEQYEAYYNQLVGLENQEIDKIEKKYAEKAAKEAQEAKKKKEENNLYLRESMMSASEKELNEIRKQNAELERRLKLENNLTEEQKKRAIQQGKEREKKFLEEKMPKKTLWGRQLDDLKEAAKKEEREWYEAMATGDKKKVAKEEKEKEEAAQKLRFYSVIAAKKDMDVAIKQVNEKQAAFDNARTTEEKLSAKDALDAAKSKVDETTNRFYQASKDKYQNMISVAGQEAQQVSRGTFSAYALDTTAQSRIPQETLDYIKKIFTKVENIDSNATTTFSEV